MNIDIYMAPKDENNLEGLCGNFDGNVQNDFKHSDGTSSSHTLRQPNAFSSSWR